MTTRMCGICRAEYLQAVFESRPLFLRLHRPRNTLVLYAFQSIFNEIGRPGL